ncbi:MAG: protein phosphatase 2C domain-containing protein [Gammaproteobacteria bacterium]|nr:protein phosphatase 2C domain-containing protein [Gammaproteobacteria bacterium]
MNEPGRPFEAARASLIGNRGCNQDRSILLSNSETILLGLADGLGGHPRGEVAAQIVVGVCESLFRRAPIPLPDPERFMLQCIGKAHHAILRFGRRQKPIIAPRTTAVLAVIQSGMAYWVHVGDSRLYLIRNGRIHRQTRDHAQVRFVRQSAQESSRPRASLTRCLGGVVEPPTTTCSSPTLLRRHDTILLCSDGLWGQLAPGRLAVAFQDEPPQIADSLQSLVETAAARPNSDNVTAVALRWQAEVADLEDEASADDPRLEQAVRHLRSMLEKTQET